MPKRLGVHPHDSTSNQLWIDSELHSEANAELLRKTAEELKDRGWLHIYTRVVSSVYPPFNLKPTVQANRMPSRPSLS